MFHASFRCAVNSLPPLAVCLYEVVADSRVRILGTSHSECSGLIVRLSRGPLVIVKDGILARNYRSVGWRCLLS